MAKKAPAKKAPVKRRPAKKTPVQPVETTIERSDLSPECKKLLLDILEPKEPAKSSSPWRRSMLVAGVVAGLVVSFLGGIWSAGGIEIGPRPKNDAVSAVFDTQEASFRKNLGGLAAALRSGQVKSEAEANTWMDARFGPESESAWVPLLTEEAAAFGGKEWTAEKHAAHIERYAR